MEVKPWLPSYTGRVLDILEPTPDMVDVHDVAHALSMTCRYGGHCREFYSVAEHSVLVHDIALNILHDAARTRTGDFPLGLTPLARLVVFLHDAAEAYVGDLISPIKRSIPTFQLLENRWTKAVDDHFELDGALAVPSVPLKNLIREADTLAVSIEVVSLYPNPSDGWWERFPVPTAADLASHPIGCLSPSEARRKFLSTFFKLEGARGKKMPWKTALPLNQEEARR